MAGALAPRPAIGLGTDRVTVAGQRRIRTGFPLSDLAKASQVTTVNSIQLFPRPRADRITNLSVSIHQLFAFVKHQFPLWNGSGIIENNLPSSQITCPAS